MYDLDDFSTKVSTEVELTFLDRTTMRGWFFASRTQRVSDVLNDQRTSSRSRTSVVPCVWSTSTMSSRSGPRIRRTAAARKASRSPDTIPYLDVLTEFPPRNTSLGLRARPRLARSQGSEAAAAKRSSARSPRPETRTRPRHRPRATALPLALPSRLRRAGGLKSPDGARSTASALMDHPGMVGQSFSSTPGCSQQRSFKPAGRP